MSIYYIPSATSLNNIQLTLNCIREEKILVARVLENRYTVGMDQELGNLKQLGELVNTAKCGPNATNNPTEGVILLPKFALTNISTQCIGFAAQSLSLFKFHGRAIRLLQNGSWMLASKQLQNIENTARPLAKRCEVLISQADFLCGMAEQAYQAAIREGLPLYAEKEESSRTFDSLTCPNENVFVAIELNAKIEALQQVITARGKILTIFQNSRIFWSEVKAHLLDATDVRSPRLYLKWKQPGRSEMELDKLYINMLALNKIARTMSTILAD